MVLKLQDKKSIVAECHSVAQTATSLVVADYHGVPVSRMTELRAQAKEKQVYLKVMRNTLVRRALECTDFACASSVIKGPSIVAFSGEEPGAAAKIIESFIKDNQSFVVKTLAMRGKLLPPDQLKVLASLPNRQEALAKFAGLLKQPAVKLVSTLTDVPSKLVRVLSAVCDQKKISQS